MNTPMPQSAFAGQSAALPRSNRPEFIHRHLVCFEETHLVGNVYFVRHLAWQGRCREMFLREHAPSVLDALADDLRLVTLRVECEYFEEFRAFDTVEIRMRLARQTGHRIALDFDYHLVRPERPPAIAARGAQEIGCMRDTPAGLVTTEVPPALLAALQPYAN